MRNRLLTMALAIGLLLAMAVPVTAATLHDPHQDTDLKCATGEIGVWHFVNNKTDGASAGWLTVTFSDGSTVGPVGPDKVNRNVQHWWIRGPNDSLDTAETTLLGMLVLSDAFCEKKTT